MNRFDTDVEIEIDRLILRGMGLPYDRAEYIRTRVEQELQRMLDQSNKTEDIGSHKIVRLAKKLVQLTAIDDEQLIIELSQNIVHLLSKTGQ